MTGRDRLLRYLSDGHWHTTHQLLRRDFDEGHPGMTVHSRAADLRAHGHVIVCDRVPGKEGAHAYRYRLLSREAGGRRPPLLASRLSESLTEGAAETVGPRTEPTALSVSEPVARPGPALTADPGPGLLAHCEGQLRLDGEAA